MGLKRSGGGSFSSGLEKFGRKLKDVADTKRVPFGEMFPPDFMRRHTKAADFNEFFALGGFEIESREDLKNIDESAWEAHVPE